VSLRDWWHRRTAAADAERVATRTRVVSTLEPVIEAERARGNEPADGWSHSSFGGPSGAQLDRHLRYPLDGEALQAEFEFDRSVWLAENRVGSIPGGALLHGGDAPHRAEDRAAWERARESWWTRWRAEPRPRRRLSDL
jgi:hypothetical protein